MFLDRGISEAEVGRRGARSRARRLRSGRDVDSAAVMESLDFAVIGRGRDGVILTWSLGAERLYGYTAEEIVGLPLDLLVPAAVMSREADAGRACMLAGLIDSYQTTRLCKSGKEIAVNIELAPVRTRAGVIVGVSTSEHGVSAAGLLRPPIPGTETFLKTAFEDAPVGMALVGVEPGSAGRVIRVNRATCELTGYPIDALEGSELRRLLHPDDLGADADAVRRLCAGEIASVQLEQRLLHRERHAVWVMSSASLVRSDEGKPLYCIRQMQDIQERKRYEGELGFLIEHDPRTAAAGPCCSWISTTSRRSTTRSGTTRAMRC
jgi:PAS domain S-box-containing protein